MYQALYRKYRPQTFDEVLGQDHITTTLKHQIEKGNIGHAYLFSGTRGTGKTSSAKIFSRAVNCLDLKNGNPCNQCDICKGILDESIMDVIEMDAASNNSVDDIRDLRDKVIYPPSRTKYKVYIIDEVHMLSKGAFNALLKTLEEPPKHLIFILATTEPERLPQTILSRCQRFDFKRITNDHIVQNMKKITQSLNVEVDEKVLRLIARNSDGAMRDAQSLLDQCISFNEEKITYEDATNILGITNEDLLFNMVDDILEKSLEKTLGTIDDIIQNGKDIHQFIKDLIYHFRNLMVVKTSNKPEEIMESEDIEALLVQSKKMKLEYILSALQILTTADASAKWSTQPRIILEVAMIKLVKLEEELSLEERIKRLEMGIRDKVQSPVEQKVVERKVLVTETTSVKKEEEIKEEEEPAKAETIIDDGSELTLDTINNQWSAVMQTIKTKKINIYALLLEGEVVSFENNLLTIGYKEGFGFHKEAISSPNNKAFVEEIIGAHFNKPIVMSFISGNKTTKSNPNKVNTKDQAINEIIDLFGEDVVEII
ncbi:MAG: DNA polymerase III subunit gamma/tau [Tissierellia bacterium]|nr:DNA polymerase III subunit gamma/tau [Tissierellia bacterium]